MAVRLSDISSKTGKKCLFCVFWPILSLCRIAAWPYRLSYKNALRINQFYSPKDQSIKFSQKILRIGDFEKRFFWVGHFEFFFREIFFFCFFPMKTSQSLLVSKDVSKFWSSRIRQHFLTLTKHFASKYIWK